MHGKTLGFPSSLQIHGRTHSGEKPEVADSVAKSWISPVAFEITGVPLERSLADVRIVGKPSFSDVVEHALEMDIVDARCVGNLWTS